MFSEARYKDLIYISLVFSTDRQDHLGTVMQQVRQDRPSQVNNWHFQLLDHPREEQGSFRQHIKLANIGQGTRAYMVKTQFAQYLDSQLVWQWVDVWMRAEAASYGGGNNPGNVLRTAVLFPAIGEHPVLRSSATRGSERIAALISAPEMVNRPYVTISFDKQWGLSNRVNTLVGMLAFTNSMCWGLHALWKCNDATTDEFPEMFTVLQRVHELPGTAFIVIHHDPAKFAPYLSSTLALNKGNFRFQCTPEQFLAEMRNNLPPQRSNTNPVWHSTTTSKVFEAPWKALGLPGHDPAVAGTEHRRSCAHGRSCVRAGLVH